MKMSKKKLKKMGLGVAMLGTVMASQHKEGFRKNIEEHSLSKETNQENTVISNEPMENNMKNNDYEQMKEQMREKISNDEVYVPENMPEDVLQGTDNLKKGFSDKPDEKEPKLEQNGNGKIWVEVGAGVLGTAVALGTAGFTEKKIRDRRKKERSEATTLEEGRNNEQENVVKINKEEKDITEVKSKNGLDLV